MYCYIDSDHKLRSENSDHKLNIAEKEYVGYGSFKICNVKKTFADKTSGKYLFSPDIEIFGNKWYVGMRKQIDNYFSIYLSNIDKEK